jgi:hypothetical protein
MQSLISILRSLWSALVRHPWWCAGAALSLFLCFAVLPNALVWTARVVLLALCAAAGARLVELLRTAARNPKPALFGLVAVALGLGIAYGLLEFASWVYLKKVPVAGNPFVLTEKQTRFVESIINEATGYQVYSPTLGWTIGKSQSSKDGLYQSNSDGFRANREYASQKPPGKLRVLCFGDSYTHGDEVGNHDTWEHHAEKAAPDIEFLNFGVPGFGLTQAFLRYQEVAEKYPADYVIIGCMSEDTKRGVNAYYPFRYPNAEQSPNAAALPFATLDEKGELLVHPPVLTSREDYAAFLKDPLPMIRKMSEVDILFHPPPSTPFLKVLANRWESLHEKLDPAVDHLLASWHRVFHKGGKPRTLRDLDAVRNGERRRRIIEVSRRMFRRFALEVQKNGAVPIIMWFPSPTNLEHHNAGRARDYAHYFEFFAEKEWAAVDTLDWIVELGGEGQPLALGSVLKDVHFSASTNAHIGGRLADFIRVLDKEPKLE